MLSCLNFSCLSIPRFLLPFTCVKFFYSNEAISFPLLSGDPNIGVKMRMRVAKSSYHTKAGSSEHLHLRTATNCQLSFIAPLKYLKWYWARLWGPGTSNFLCIYHFYFLPSPTCHYRLRFKLRTAQSPCMPCNIHTFCLVLIKLFHCTALSWEQTLPSPSSVCPAQFMTFVVSFSRYQLSKLL